MAGPSIQLGWHWILDGSGCTSERLGSRETLLHLLCELPLALGLTRVAEPQLHEHSQPEPLLVGLVLLAESHFSVHARPHLGLIHVDLFSCVSFDGEHAQKLVCEAYAVPEHSTQWIERRVPQRPERA